MSEHKIYAVKASRCGRRFSGRFKAINMRDATNQAHDYLKKFGSSWNVQINELKNQKLAMKQWEESNS